MSTALSIVLDLEVFILKKIIRVNMMTMHAKRHRFNPPNLERKELNPAGCPLTSTSVTPAPPDSKQSNKNIH